MNYWKVQIDGGVIRTRTLDKYFDINTLPKKPRWRDVLNTAHFVLKFCSATSPLKEEIEKETHYLITLLEKNRIYFKKA